MSDLTKKVIYTPRTGTEMEEATGHKVPILKYSELCDLAKRIGSTRMLAHMFRQAKHNIILLQNPMDMSSGHWYSVSCNPTKKEIYFFSTYGKRPDIEKLEWMSDDDMRESGQDLNIFNDAMRDYQERGWEIHYNDVKYQKEGDKTATCGLFTAAFINSGLNPDEFKQQIEELKRCGIQPEFYFYQQYFQ